MSQNKASQNKVVPMPLRSPGGANAAQLQRLKPLHLSIMDYMLAHPQLPMSALAAHFDKSLSWVSTVTNTDIFQAQLAERRAQIQSLVDAEIKDKALGLARKGLDALSDAMDDEATSVAMKHTITRTGLEVMGYLGKGGPSVTVNNNTQNNTVVNDPTVVDAVAEARKRILERAAARGSYIPGVAREALPQGEA